MTGDFAHPTNFRALTATGSQHLDQLNCRPVRLSLTASTRDFTAGTATRRQEDRDDHLFLQPCSIQAHAHSYAAKCPLRRSVHSSRCPSARLRAVRFDPLMQGRGGDLIFPTSCGGAVQPRFDAALAALHSFWYKQAR